VSPVPSASVVVCAYTEDRWAEITDAVASLRTQTAPPGQVLLVIDHNDLLLARARRAFADIEVLANTGPRGLSGARNTGVGAARGDVVAFLDDDAAAEPEWLALLLAPYADPRVAGVGGAARPRFVEPPPGWLVEEFHWVIGCSYRGQPEETCEVRNFIGANMSFRRSLFEAAGPFTDGIGRVGARPVGCEETEFCIRARHAVPDAVLLYVPAAAVRHTVTANRLTVRYYVHRCWSEGLSKALVAREVGTGPALASERTYATRTLPSAVGRALRHGRLDQATAMAAGLLITTAGYGWGRVAGSPSGGSAGIAAGDVTTAA
jgi:glycosyltransferase involved in cell wall biosynthesis